jgi:hypothetical protein
MRRINKCRTSDVRLPDILVAGKKDFEASPRPRFQLHRHARRDAVIVTHASFEKISVSLKNRQKFIQSQIREIEQAIIEQKREERGSRLAKELIALPLSYVGKNQHVAKRPGGWAVVALAIKKPQSSSQRKGAASRQRSQSRRRNTPMS